MTFIPLCEKENQPLSLHASRFPFSREYPLWAICLITQMTCYTYVLHGKPDFLGVNISVSFPIHHSMLNVRRSMFILNGKPSKTMKNPNAFTLRKSWNKWETAPQAAECGFHWPRHGYVSYPQSGWPCPFPPTHEKIDIGNIPSDYTSYFSADMSDISTGSGQDDILRIIIDIWNYQFLS